MLGNNVELVVVLVVDNIIVVVEVVVVSTLTMCSRVELSKPYGGKGNAAAAAAAGAAMSWCCNVLIGCIMMVSFFVHSCECSQPEKTFG